MSISPASLNSNQGIYTTYQDVNGNITGKGYTNFSQVEENLFSLTGVNKNDIASITVTNTGAKSPVEIASMVSYWSATGEKIAEKDEMMGTVAMETKDGAYVASQTSVKDGVVETPKDNQAVYDQIAEAAANQASNPFSTENKTDDKDDQKETDDPTAAAENNTSTTSTDSTNSTSGTDTASDSGSSSDSGSGSDSGSDSDSDSGSDE